MSKPTPPARGRRAGGLFARNRSVSPPPTPSAASDYHSARSSTSSSGSSFFFPRRRASADTLRSSVTTASTRTTDTTRTAGTADTHKSRLFGVLKKNNAETDPRVRMAREKIAAATEAEAEADRALLHARARVRDAMQHIKVLEEEANNEVMRAEAKQTEAKLFSKRSRVLGRHG